MKAFVCIWKKLRAFIFYLFSFFHVSDALNTMNSQFPNESFQFSDWLRNKYWAKLRWIWDQWHLLCGHGTPWHNWKHWYCAMRHHQNVAWSERCLIHSECIIGCALCVNTKHIVQCAQMNILWPILSIQCGIISTCGWLTFG